MAQHKQAAITAMDGQAAPIPNPPETVMSTTPAAIALMPAAMRWSICSRNTSQATRAVKTLSALSRSDYAVAGRRVRPIISRTGPAMPPNTTAPASGNHS